MKINLFSELFDQENKNGSRLIHSYGIWIHSWGTWIHPSDAWYTHTYITW